MTKTQRKSAPRLPKVGDRVIPKGSESIYQITRVNIDGTEADICLENTDLERFRVSLSELTLVEQIKTRS